MLTYDLKVGQAIAIGDEQNPLLCMAFDEKSGNRIKVRIAMPVHRPVTVIANGLIPRIYVRGITGERRPYTPPHAPYEMPETAVA